MPRKSYVLHVLLTLLVLGTQPAHAQDTSTSSRGAERGQAAPASDAGADDADGTDIFDAFPVSDAEEESDDEGESDEPADAPAVPGFDDIEVLRVTGSRTESGIDLTEATSATQIDSETLQALGATDVSDIASITPNLEIRTTNSTSPTFFIRGVGLSDFNANAAGSVGVYQDGVAINAPAMQLGQLFDVENVEILRGPQGGGSGRNSSAGAIHVWSRRPVGDLNGYLSTSYGRYNAVDVTGAIEAPIIEDELSTRIAFRVQRRDGWGTNGCGNQPTFDERLADPARYSRVALCGEKGSVAVPNPSPPPPNYRISDLPDDLPSEVNDLGNWAMRAMLRYQPEANEMDWLLVARGSRVDQLSTLGQAVGTGRGGVEYGYGRTGNATSDYRDQDISGEYDAVSLAACPPGNGDPNCLDPVNEAYGRLIARRLDTNPNRGDYNRVGGTRLDTWGTSLSGTVPIDDLTFTTVTGYYGYDRYRDEDQDFTPNQIIESVTDDQGWQFSQELRLDGELERHPVGWQVGGYYLMERLESDAELFIQTQETLQDWEQKLYSFALFAGFDWEFLDVFTLEAAARYNWERKSFDEALKVGNGPYRVLPGETRTWQAPTGTVKLVWAPRDDLSFYWSYAHGWKGGHFNATASPTTTELPDPAEPEKIDAFEIGMKGVGMLDGRLEFSTSLFHYAYEDYQVFIINDNFGQFPSINIINANNAETYGAEVETVLQPLLDWVPAELEQLVVTTRFAWLHSEFLDFTNEVSRPFLNFPNPPIIRAATIDYSGNPLINAPRFKVSIAVDWLLPLGRWGTIAPRYDGSWSDDVYFDPNKGRGIPNLEGENLLPELATGQEALWLHNVSLRYRTPNDRIEVQGWVRNLTDERYKTFAFDASTFNNQTVNFIGLPRTFGVTLSLFYQ